MVRAGTRYSPRHARLLDPRIGERNGPRPFLDRLHRPPARRDFGARRDLAVGRLCVFPDLGGGHVARNDDDRVIRSVKAPVEGKRVVAGQGLDLRTPSDHRTPVRVIEIKGGVDLLRKPAVRVVGDPHILLFEHDIKLGAHHRIGECQTGDAVGLERHHVLEMLARHPLEEAGIVARRERVLLPADRGDRQRETAVGMLRGALEHQMFEKVREP